MASRASIRQPQSLPSSNCTSYANAPSASAGKAPSFSSALPSPTSDSSVELSRPLPVDGTPPRSARALHSDLFVDVRCMKSDSRPTTQDSANGRHDWPRAASSIAHGDKHTTLSHDRPNCSGNRLDQIIVPSAAHAPWPPASASSPAHDNRGSRRFRQHMYRRSLFSRTNSSLSPPSVRDPILTPTRLSEVTEVPHESGTLRSVRASAETINAALSNVQATELCAQSRRRSDEISRQWSRSDISDGQINSASALAGYERHFSPSGQGYTQRSEAMSYGPLTRQFSGRSFACSGISAGSSDHCGIDHGPSGIADVGRCESFTGRSVPVSRARAQLDGCAFDVRADHLRHHHSHQHSASFLTHEADLVNAEVRRPSRSLPHLKRSSRPDPLLTANVEWRDPSSEHLQEGVEHYEYYHRHNRRDAGQHSCQRSKSADFERARKGSLDAIRIETEVRVDVS
ncbi:hypothetical protein BDZ90DRAFT_134562 [Jaminaea rosea]|uniref:Uncharacterized protein n=1 Tax=Jaminaea rosea TaxID=1569628 RepID=A0A316UYE2_9BASI|nr:hypothetical protein BDZ90DRAFT_134562 [Jaminaea rosea]PWN28923.1 hypothetical protein BDZ90DRAFT_134562 [Jaminaea rosea]